MTAVLRVVSGVLVNPGGDILMGLRPHGKRRGGLWELPGGKVDDGEEPRHALSREWQEELDLGVRVGDFIASASLTLEVPLFIDLYEVRPVREDQKMKNNAHDAVRWVDARHAMEYLPCSPAYYLHYPHLMRWLGVQT